MKIKSLFFCPIKPRIIITVAVTLLGFNLPAYDLEKSRLPDFPADAQVLKYVGTRPSGFPRYYKMIMGVDQEFDMVRYFDYDISRGGIFTPLVQQPYSLINYHIDDIQRLDREGEQTFYGPELNDSLEFQAVVYNREIFFLGFIITNGKQALPAIRGETDILVQYNVMLWNRTGVVRPYPLWAKTDIAKFHISGNNYKNCVVTLDRGTTLFPIPPDPDDTIGRSFKFYRVLHAPVTRNVKIENPTIQGLYNAFSDGRGVSGAQAELFEFWYIDVSRDIPWNH